MWHWNMILWSRFWVQYLLSDFCISKCLLPIFPWSLGPSWDSIFGRVWQNSVQKSLYHVYANSSCVLNKFNVTLLCLWDVSLYGPNQSDHAENCLPFRRQAGVFTKPIHQGVHAKYLPAFSCMRDYQKCRPSVWSVTVRSCCELCLTF